MQSSTIQIGFKRFYATPVMRCIEYDRRQDENENENEGSHYSSAVVKKCPSRSPLKSGKTRISNDKLCIPRTTSFGFNATELNKDSNSPTRRLFTPFLSTIYNEIVNIWFQEKWLVFVNNNEETFLILHSDIKGYLNVQMAINQNCFVNSKSPLLKEPECLLIRTEKTNKSLFLPNSVVSFEHYCDGNKNVSQGKLMAIICESDKTNSKLMFYKHSLTNNWYMFYTNNSKPSQRYSNVLSNEQQLQLDTILKENYHLNFIHPSQLIFPLAALCSHPIIYVYIIQKTEP